MKRLIVQILAFLGINSDPGPLLEAIAKGKGWFAKLAFNINKIIPHTAKIGKNVCMPALNCYSCPAAGTACPVGTAQHFISVGQTPYFVVGTMAAIGAVAGRITCGWICPFGWIQELLYKINSFKFRLPKWFGYFKYLSLLLLVIFIPFFTHETWFCKVCPAGTIEAGIPWILMDPSLRRLLGELFAFKITVLITFITLSVFTKRPFCRFCPLGAFFGLFNKLSFFKLHVDTNKCNQCDFCYRVCPMGLKPYENPNSDECIRCLECTDCELITFKPAINIEKQQITLSSTKNI